MRPHTICLMMTSLDGKTDADAIGLYADPDLFEQTHPKLEGDAWLCGRTTLQRDFAEFAEPEPFHNDGSDPIGEDAVHVARTGGTFAVAADTGGQIVWKGGEVDGDHVITLTSQKASKRFLGELRERGASYIVAGETEINLPAAFDTLGSAFGIGRLIVEGGGHINGAVLEAGLIDEFSLLLTPGIDGREGPSVAFDGRPAQPLSAFPASLLSVERLEHDVLWLRYRVEGRKQG